MNFTLLSELLLANMSDGLSNLSKTSFEGNSSSSSEGPVFDEYIFDRTAVRIALYVAYTAVFCFCFFGNLAVVIVFTVHWRMRSVTKFCMGNLAFANLCVSIFCIYQNLSTFLQENWIFGRFLCKMYYFTNSLSHTASILILVVICVERYLSIVHPLKCRRMLTIQRLRFTIVCVWLVSGLISAPRLYYITTFQVPFPIGVESEVICAPVRTMYNSRTADIAVFVLLFLLPLFAMSILYSKIGSIIWQSSSVLQSSSSSSASVQFARNNPKLHHQQAGPKVSSNGDKGNSGRHSSSERKSSSSERKSSSSERNSSSSERKSSSSERKSSSSGYEPGMKRAGSSSAALLSAVSFNNQMTCSSKVKSNESEVGRCGRPEKHRVHVVLLVKDERRGQVLKSRQAAIRLLIVIVITFAILNLPYHLRKMCQYYVPNYNIGSSFNQFMTPVTFLLMYTNCAVNPILYAFMSQNFRSSLRDLIRLKLSRRRGARGSF